MAHTFYEQRSKSFMADVNPLNDEELVERVKKQSKDAFRVLYERYKMAMFNYFYHLLGNRQTAEDCTHDLFIRVYDKAALYVPGRKFSSWLYTMAKNLAFDALRKNKIRRASSLDEHAPSGAEVSLHEFLESPDFDPRAVAQSAEYKAILKKGLSQLRTADEQIIVLCDIHGLSHREVSSTLGYPEKSIAVKLFRARQHLLKILERSINLKEL